MGTNRTLVQFGGSGPQVLHMYPAFPVLPSPVNTPSEEVPQAFLLCLLL